jgi:hypothetical protein
MNPESPRAESRFKAALDGDRNCDLPASERISTHVE